MNSGWRIENEKIITLLCKWQRPLFCKIDIPIEAVRCPNCTLEILVRGLESVSIWKSKQSNTSILPRVGSLDRELFYMYIIYNIYIQEDSMALNIANRRVEQKAIQASRILGVNKTAAVEKALDYYLKNYCKKKSNEAVLQEVARLFDEFADLPELDERTPDEILGYDGDGLV